MENEAVKDITLQVEGMTCNNCAIGLKKHLEDNSINNVSVDFSLGEVNCSANHNTKDEIISIIEEIGYKVKNPDQKEKKYSKVEILFCISLIFTIPLFSHMFLGHDNILYDPLVQLILCLPVYFIGIIYFGKSAFGSLKIGVPNMDVLIFIGSSAAFFYSIYGWWLFYGTNQVNDYLFFETSATIITLVLLGNVLEHRSVKQTTTALKELSNIQKITAKKIENEKIIEIKFEEIKQGDILIINSGDIIPTDGKIIWGDCTVDESMLTGESLPINKTIKSNVIGGTILINGSIKIEATTIGNKTILSQIIKLVKDAQKDQPKIQKIGDKVSSIFVPIVIGISICTFFISHFMFNLSSVDAFLRSVAVLVISCPCAMGLATPTAIMVGIGRAAKNGILIKGGQTLEKMANINNIAFDKTGTITTGKFRIQQFNVIEGDEKEIKNIIYNIEKHSSHPIANSLIDELTNFSSELHITDIKEKNGVGISAKYNHNNYFIGKDASENQKEKFDIYIKKDDKIIATINLKDEIKDGTTEVIQTLKNNGYSTILISGDRQEKCEQINKTLSFNKLFFNQLPENKLKVIDELNTNNDTIMLGDGINDAPALARATLGISLGNASQIAIQSSEIILLNNNNLKQLPKALKISQHTLLTIKQNLFWAFSYNIIAIPIACLGYLNPMWAALFMAFSDVVVIGNSIRLKFKKIF
ncbi:MAG: cation-translocating P-type ATPase [Flavobacteriales bacterium]|nr:cation-translocating P-type ATPase [Flavobacteriales bacterium]